jgi:hypothetical protein
MTNDVETLEFAKDCLRDLEEWSKDPEQDGGILNLRWLIKEVEDLRAKLTDEENQFCEFCGDTGVVEPESSFGQPYFCDCDKGKISQLREENDKLRQKLQSQESCVPLLVADALLTGSSGVQAQRLILEADGGWCHDAIVNQVAEAFSKAAKPT